MDRRELVSTLRLVWPLARSRASAPTTNARSTTGSASRKVPHRGDSHYGLSMTRLALAALVLCACAPEPAAPSGKPSAAAQVAVGKGRKLEGTWSTRHWLDHLEECGSGCEYRTRSRSTVGIELMPNGAARVVDDGQSEERFAATNGTRAHLTEWNRTWTGTWSEGAQKLQLKLEEAGHDCKRTRDDGHVDDALCSELKLTLQCDRMRILLAQDTPKTSWAWVCDTDAVADGLTPLPWVFGEERVLVAIDTGKNRPTTRRYMTTRPQAEKGKKAN